MCEGGQTAGRGGCASIPDQGRENSQGHLGELRIPMMRVAVCPANWAIHCAGPSWALGAEFSVSGKVEAGEDLGSCPADSLPGGP